MQSSLIKFINRYYYIICFIILLLVNLPILDNLLLGDDYNYIFRESSSIKQNTNPLTFLFPWSPQFKSWGLTYITLWSEVKLFSNNYVYYRFVNLSLHFINFYILSKILNSKFSNQSQKNKIISLFFLFHPLSILTYSWIFQVKTLLAVMFILLFLRLLWSSNLNRISNRIKITVFFILSILSKSVGILLPIYTFYYLYKKKLSAKSNIMITLPLIVISFFYGLINIKGITYLTEEIKNISSQVDNANAGEYKTNKNESADQVKQDELNSHYASREDINFNIHIMEEIKLSTTRYAKRLTEFNTLLESYIITIQNYGRLTLSLLGINNYYPFYEPTHLTFNSMKVYIYILLGSLLLVLTPFLNHYLILVVTLTLPITGMFYIPYMKYSHSSDHWFYPATIGLILLVGSYIKNIKILSSLSLVILISYCLTIFKYRDTNELLTQNFITYKNPFALESKSVNDIILKQRRVVFGIYDYLLMNVDHENSKYYFTLSTNTEVATDKLYRRYISRFARQAIEKHDGIMLNQILLLNATHITSKSLALINSMQAIFTHNLTSTEYENAMKSLE